jgi:hypothetical protein
MSLLIAAVLVAYTATVLASGTPIYLIPAGLVAVIVGGYMLAEHLLSRRHSRMHGGDSLAAMRDDEDWAIPSAHLIDDDATAVGDTTEVHSEINPHDLPPDHPGRRAAEVQAAESGTFETSGNVEGGAGGDFEGREDATEERTGERQRSARFAKGSGSPAEEGQYAEGKTSTPGQRP